MKSILRISDQKTLKDYDLQSLKKPFVSSGIRFIPQAGEWYFESSKDVMKPDGEAVNHAVLKNYSVYMIDPSVMKTMLVLPKRERQAFVMRESVYTIGRVKENSLSLQDHTITSRHCVIYKPNKKHIYLADLNSMNGTFVNAKRIVPKKPILLKEGDLINIGSYSVSIITESGEVFPMLNELDKNSVIHPENTESRSEISRKYFSSIAENKVKHAPKTGAWNGRFSIQPRQLPLKPLCQVSIESAPSLTASKPGIGMVGLGMSLPTMAMGIGMSAVKYFLEKDKYSKEDQYRAEVYGNYTEKIEKQLENHHVAERTYAQRIYPDLSSCIKRTKKPYTHLWERQPGDEDFLSLRFGQTKQPSSAVITIPSQQLKLYEDPFEKIPAQIKERYEINSSLPVTASLMEDGVLGIVGSKKETDRLVQSLVLQTASLQNYSDVRIVLLCEPEDIRQYEWMRWLPHTCSIDKQRRYILSEKQDLTGVFGEETAIIEQRLEKSKEWGYGGVSSLPFFVFIVLNQSILEGSAVGRALAANRKDLNVSGIVVGRAVSEIPHTVHTIAYVEGNGSSQLITLKGNKEYSFNSSEACVQSSVYETAARNMAALYLSGVSGSGKYVLPQNIGLFEGMGFKSVKDIRVREMWGKTFPEDKMAVPIGKDETGETVYFDIHESVHGPHGLVAGAAGSGKSKMVQTWIASMAYHFSPRDINFVLVDFKGESLIEPFRKLPHVACFTSNLDPDVRRKFLSIDSEMDRRMTIFRDYHCEDILDYRKKRRSNPSMPEVPFLFLIVDEFANFKTEFPEFTEPLDRLFRIGRALGFLAVVLTQNPSGKVTDQMRSNLGFRWCLRVDSTADSNEVIETGDAAKLTNPGRAYFKSKNKMKLMQAYFGGFPYTPKDEDDSGNADVFAVDLKGRRKKHKSGIKSSDIQQKDELTVFSETIADYCEKNGIESAKPIWQKELPSFLDLESLKAEENQAAAVIGLYDDPSRQKQSVLQFRPASDVSLAVYGAPQSGKTTFLEAMILSLALNYTPEDINFYIVEYGGFRLESYKNLPHTGSYCNEGDPGCISRVIKYLVKEISRRKQIFHKNHVSSIEGYYELKGKDLPLIMLVLDNVNSLLQFNSEFQLDLIRILKEGGAYGISFAASYSGSSGVYQFNQFMRNSYALRLADKSDYSGIVGIVRDDPSNMPAGRGFLRKNNDTLQFQTGIIYADQSDAKRHQLKNRRIEEIAKQWDGKLPVQILSMPDALYYGEVKGAPYILGLENKEVRPYILDIEKERSFLVSYDNDEIRRSLIRSLIRQAQEKGGNVYLFSKEAEDYKDLDIYCAERSFPSFKKQIEDLTPELKSRSADRNGSYPTILIIIDGIGEILEEPESADGFTLDSRLEGYVRLGEKINFGVVVFEQKDVLNQSIYSVSSLLMANISKGPKMIAGGSIGGHRLISAASLESEKPDGLSWDEGVVEDKDGRKCIVRLMQGE